MRTEKSPRLTLVSDTGGEGESGYVFDRFGPVKAGLIPTQPTLDQQLEELLSCLESKVTTLESKYSEVCDTLKNDILPLVERLVSIKLEDGTDGI